MQPLLDLPVPASMNNSPKQPDALPPEGSVDPETVAHTEHGIPAATHEDQPTGTPNSDRHHGEVTPTKP